MAARLFMRNILGARSFTQNFSTSNSLRQIGKTYQPNKLERKFLVWTGKYKTVEEVPPMVSVEVMERCWNRMRIRISNIMIVGTIFGCIIMIISGKRAAGRGESVAKQNLDWHKKYNQENQDVKN